MGLVLLGHYSDRDALALLGVQVFFVLSGFLITELLLREIANTETVCLRRFYARRALRIAPAYFIFLAVLATVLHQRGVSLPRAEWITAITYTANYYTIGQPPGLRPLAHIWSLAIEEQFYLLWPAGLLLLGSRRRRLAAVLCGVVVGCLGWRFVATGPLHWPERYIRFAFETRCDMLAAGGLLAVIVRALQAPLPGAACWGTLVTADLLAVSTAVLTDRRYFAVSYTVDAVLIATLIGRLIWRPRGTAWLDSRPFRWLGERSYGIYLYHLLGWRIAQSCWGSGLGAALAGTALTIVLAASSYRLVERPVLRWRDRRLPPRTNSSAGACATSPSSTG